jgi:F0F1-type ATP synthase assembly protein I
MMIDEDEYNQHKGDDEKKITALATDLKEKFKEEKKDKDIKKNEENRSMYIDTIRLPTTIAGFITLGTGIAVIVKAIWMTSIFGDLTWYVILLVGILLIIIGIFAVSRS